MLSPKALRARRNNDYEIVKRMSGHSWLATPYRSMRDLHRQQNAVTDASDAALAVSYRVTYPFSTLVGPGVLRGGTVIAFNTDVPEYPYEEPYTTLLTATPYSPHFLEGRPVCLGSEVWVDLEGRGILGELFTHVARLLNWEERLRADYVGWNAEAIEWHKVHYGVNRPLQEHLRHPEVPIDLLFDGGSLRTNRSAGFRVL